MSWVINATWKDADLSLLQGCLDFKVKQAVSHHKVFIRTFILRPFLKVTKLSRQTACSSLSSLKPNCEQGKLTQIKTLHETRERKFEIGLEEELSDIIINQAYLKVGVVVQGYHTYSCIDSIDMLMHTNTEHSPNVIAWFSSEV